MSSSLSVSGSALFIQHELESKNHMHQKAIFFMIVTVAAYSAADVPNSAQCLKEAYPTKICSIERNTVVWCDGTRVQLNDGHVKNHQTKLSQADLEDQLSQKYIRGPIVAPRLDDEPGRIRNDPFFRKMYGNSRKEVGSYITKIRWAPTGTKTKVTTVNNVHKKLEAVGRALAKLPPRFKKYLKSRPQTWVWRNIRGTSRLSSHSFGIAVDIAVKHSHYWRWTKNRNGQLAYKNSIPLEIVSIFEDHGFIWGGRWYRYDTMHFEYRPELLAPSCRAKR